MSFGSFLGMVEARRTTLGQRIHQSKGYTAIKRQIRRILEAEGIPIDYCERLRKHPKKVSTLSINLLSPDLCP